MKTKSRIKSILNTPSLDSSITNYPSFQLKDLDFEGNPSYELPTNLRLGHLAEKVVSQLIQHSTNYHLLHENIQLIQNKNTLGELDFILEETNAETSIATGPATRTNQLIHLELAYKFYLYDPTISTHQVNNWIGPNRNDSLQEKLHKLNTRQFPLLNHPVTKAKLPELDLENVKQALCFLINLYIPYEYKESLNPVYEKAIKGYYLTLDQFKARHRPENLYYIPTKLEWGMDPQECEDWKQMGGVEAAIEQGVVEEQSLLCWKKDGEWYEEFFVSFWNHY